MNKKIEAKLRRLTEKQAEALKKIIKKPLSTSSITGYSGKSLGGVVSSLMRNSFIEPIGKINRQLRWELTEELKNEISANRKEILQLLSKICHK